MLSYDLPSDTVSVETQSADLFPLFRLTILMNRERVSPSGPWGAGPGGRTRCPHLPRLGRPCPHALSLLWRESGHEHPQGAEPRKGHSVRRPLPDPETRGLGDLPLAEQWFSTCDVQSPLVAMETACRWGGKMRDRVLSCYHCLPSTLYQDVSSLDSCSV